MVKNAEMASSKNADIHMGTPNTWRMMMPPANNVRASHEMSTVTMVYHASMFRVDGPKRSPINSGSVCTLLPR